MGLLDRLSAALAPAADDDQLVAAAPAQRVRTILRRFWPFARPFRRRWLLGLLLAAALPAVEAVEIWLFKSVVDDVLVPADLAALWPLAAAMASLALAGALLSFGDEYIATWVGERFTVAVRAAVFDHLQRLEPDALDRRRHGDVLSRLSGDLHAIETLLLSALAEAVQAAARLLFFVAALFVLSWKLALVSLIVVPPLWFAARHFGRLARRAARERRRRSGTVNTVLEEALANSALVQAANAQAHEQARLRREAEGASEAELAGTRIAGLFAPVINLIELLGAIVIIALGTWALSSGDLTLGGLLAFLAYLSQLYRPLRDLTRLYTSVFEATAGAERVMELLDTQPRVVERPGAHDLVRAAGRLELRGVHFAYDRLALADASLVVPPGRFVALTGASGAGKSTVAKLAVRFLDPDAGTVHLDGHDVRDLTLQSLRRNVALLLQDAPLLDGTIADNVAYGHSDATDADVRRALAVTGLDLDPATPVGQKGRALSGGQRRRVAMARALLQDAPVLILDEPTAGLDPDAARELIAPLRAIARDRATLLITHDPVLAEAADEVIVLDGGRVQCMATR
ncbi:ABC transporter ATP-binding protein [Solirubrobacter sp. CPCC 204708]|uniref:ABC transporter ATP-binding protein/permease n=1 Tax=Solirubrobacter deserti TaxID=2282478 RepID=A0ABT4RMM4_9ACTN|nr:ABC transporter ATP-binding protein [Solirubrobacter deserti]MBE2316991.1 ABC transporter ATP-binding protein [Solirubrobacter deserti]MDA0139822.1 ABC transporter ATP-binding protein/permease [Solirubrobacter deserti]